VARDAGFGSDVPGYRAFLASDAQFIAPSRDALREGIRRPCASAWTGASRSSSASIPRITYGVQSIPDAVSVRMPPAYAQPSPADGSAAGIFWISGLPSKAPAICTPHWSCTKPGLGT
jgi:uncharacterized protein (DUF885 family)